MPGYKTISDENGGWNFEHRTGNAWVAFNYRGTSRRPVMVKLRMMHAHLAAGFHPCGDWVEVEIKRIWRAEQFRPMPTLKDGDDEAIDLSEWAIEGFS